MALSSWPVEIRPFARSWFLLVHVEGSYNGKEVIRDWEFKFDHIPDQTEVDAWKQEAIDMTIEEIENPPEEVSP